MDITFERVQELYRPLRWDASQDGPFYRLDPEDPVDVAEALSYLAGDVLVGEFGIEGLAWGWAHAPERRKGFLEDFFKR